MESIGPPLVITNTSMKTYVDGTLAPIAEPLSLHLNQDNWNNDTDGYIYWLGGDTIIFNQTKLTTQFFIPFLFVLAIVFGVLELASPIKNKAANLIVALAISFFAATYGPFMNIIWIYLPSVTWFFIIMFFIVFIMEIFGMRGKKTVEADKIVLSGVVLFLLLTVGWMVLDQTNIEIPLIGSGENILLILGIIFILIILWGAYKMGSGEIPQQPQQP